MTTMRTATAAENVDSEKKAERLAWQRPSWHKIDASSAEVGGSTHTDFSTFLS
jgi:hypothetical protein